MSHKKITFRSRVGRTSQQSKATKRKDQSCVMIGSILQQRGIGDVKKINILNRLVVLNECYEGMDLW